jgi:hypothetical protein
MRLPTIEHPTGRENFSIVTVGEWSFAFSYRTLVAFLSPTEGWRVCENVWSTTTGKHLNYLDPDKGSRIPFEEFSELVSRIEVSE